MDNCDDKNIGEELATTLSTCFEIFFEKANEKLQYLIDRLDELRQNKDLSEVKIQLQNKMFTKLAEAEILYPAFDLEDD